MKILFITQKEDPANPLNDYMSDLLLHGLRELYGNDVVDYPGSWYLYEDESKKRNLDINDLWGKGITISNILNNYNSIDRSEISNKIKKRFFDIIIYGAIRRNDIFLEDAVNYNNKIIFVDGEDDVFLKKEIINKGLYFKRELENFHSGVFPISFAVPKNKIKKDISFKPKFLLSPLIPGRVKTYIYDNETSYYDMYQKSVFSLTYKKGGWDCLRHYEILMNGSIPIFLNLKKCPPLTLKNFPKKMVIDVNNKYDKVLNRYNPFKVFKLKFLNTQRVLKFFSYKFNDVDPRVFLEKNNELLEYRNMLYEYTKNNLTTQHLAKYLINKFIK